MEDPYQMEMLINNYFDIKAITRLKQTLNESLN